MGLDEQLGTTVLWLVDWSKSWLMEGMLSLNGLGAGAGGTWDRWAQLLFLGCIWPSAYPGRMISAPGSNLLSSSKGSDPQGLYNPPCLRMEVSAAFVPAVAVPHEYWCCFKSPVKGIGQLHETILFLFFFISWRLITLQYCSGFCHT